MQGLRFVGVGLALAVAQARNFAGRPRFNVIGADLGTREDLAKIDVINQVLINSCTLSLTAR